MTFNDKLNQHFANLDNAYDAILDAGDREALEREAFEDTLLSDHRLFAGYATLYVRKEMGLQSFLDFCWEARQAELTPAHRNGRCWHPIRRATTISGKCAVNGAESEVLKSQPR